MEEGEAARNRNDWEDALSWFEKVKQLNPGALGAERPARFAAQVCRHLRQGRSEIDKAIADGNRSRAMALARRLDQYLDGIRKMLDEGGGESA